MRTFLLNYLLLSTILFMSVSCNGIGTAVFKGATGVSESTVDSSLVFSGIDSVTNKTDSTVTLHWTPHPEAVAYEISNSGKYLKTIEGQSESSFTFTKLTPSETYSFRIRMRTSFGKYDSNTADSVVIMNPAPDTPNAVTLQSPSSSPSMSGDLTVRVNGVKQHDTVKLYTDSSCTNEVSSGIASSTSIDLITSTLAHGSYNIYARAISWNGQTHSACSSSTFVYERIRCPSGYISVTQNPDVGTSSYFCVAKYEMKNVSGVATSQASGTPWVNISQPPARTNCAALNGINGVTNKYALISNQEWMTIARDIEQVNENWSPIAGTQLKGTGVLARGHTDGNPGNSLAASTDNDPYLGTGNTSVQAANAGWEQKRTLTLSNNEVIWDFAGNVNEWVDWNVTPAKKAHPNGVVPTASWREWSTIDTLIGENPDDQMPPEKWASLFVRDVAGVLVSSPLNGTNGIGTYYSGVNNDATGAALRGGAWLNGVNSGAFSLYLAAGSGYIGTTFGFRCVYRP